VMRTGEGGGTGGEGGPPGGGGRRMPRNQPSRPAGAMNQSRRIWPVPVFVTLCCTPRPIRIMVSGSTSYSSPSIGLPGAAIAEQQLVAALMGMAADVCARLEHLQASRECVVGRGIGVDLVDHVTGRRQRLPE